MRNKNDAVDAAACREAVRRPTVRSVPVKTAEQQAQLMQHRVRDLLIGQRTQAINALRSHMAELGIVAAQGYDGLKVLLAMVADASDARLPENARASLTALDAQIACARPRSPLSTSGFSRSIARIQTASGSRPFPASASLMRVPSSLRFMMLRFSRGGATSRMDRHRLARRFYRRQAPAGTHLQAWHRASLRLSPNVRLTPKPDRRGGPGRPLVGGEGRSGHTPWVVPIRFAGIPDACPLSATLPSGPALRLVGRILSPMAFVSASLSVCITG